MGCRAAASESRSSYRKASDLRAVKKSHLYCVCVCLLCFPRLRFDCSDRSETVNINPRSSYRVSLARQRFLAEACALKAIEKGLPRSPDDVGKEVEEDEPEAAEPLQPTAPPTSPSSPIKGIFNTKSMEMEPITATCIAFPVTSKQNLLVRHEVLPLSVLRLKGHWTFVMRWCSAVMGMPIAVISSVATQGLPANISKAMPMFRVRQ